MPPFPGSQGTRGWRCHTVGGGAGAPRGLLYSGLGGLGFMSAVCHVSVPFCMPFLSRGRTPSTPWQSVPHLLILRVPGCELEPWAGRQGLRDAQKTREKAQSQGLGGRTHDTQSVSPALPGGRQVAAEADLARGSSGLLLC